MFAPAHHQATRYVIPVRRELAVRTIFNFLGPLTNPAGATRQLIGVSDPAYLETMAGRAGAARDQARAARLAARTASTSSASPRRRSVVEVRRRRAAPLHGHARRRSASRARRPRRSPAATRSRTPRRRAQILAGEPGRRARPRGAQRGRGDLRRRAAPTRSSDGVARGRAGDRRGAAAAALERFVAAHPGARAGMNRSSRSSAATRDEVAPPARSPRRVELEQRRGERGRRRPALVPRCARGVPACR